MSKERPVSVLKSGGDELVVENDRLRLKLEIAEEMVRAISGDEVDALVVGSSGGMRIRALSGADEGYRTFVEMMGQGAVTVAADGTIQYANRCFSELVLLKEQQALGASIFDFVAAEDHGQFRAMVWEALSKEIQNSLFCFQARDGSSIRVAVSAAPMTVAGVTSVCLLINNLTERDARLAAESANAAKDRFLALLSHELRTPLTPILMTIDSIEAQSSLPAEMREDMAMIRRNIELETRLIDDLLDLSRIVNGKMQLRIQQTHLHLVMESILEMLEPEIVEKSLVIERHLTAEKDLVPVDPARIQQVLWNLLKNAIKFSHAGGKIAISSRNSEESGISLEIRDEGVGIAAETLPRIFEAFEQGAITATQRFGGLGLGLAIAKALVEAHDGTISAESAGTNKGACFRVSLGLVPGISAVGTVSGALTEMKPLGLGLRVLLVEDHGDTAQVMRKLLEIMGHQVVVAGTIAAALKSESELPFDLVVSDIGLPDGTGYELMKEIHKRKGIPGIALTGHGMEDDIQRSREAGFVEHVTKPIHGGHLEEVILRVTKRGGGR